MKLYTTKQLAEICGYASDAIIRKMINDGSLKATKLGHIWVISHSIAIKNENIAKRYSNRQLNGKNKNLI